jgi:hypothetical protein
MPWTKSEVTLGQGVQVLSGRAPRMKAEVVPVYQYECASCSIQTTIVNPKNDADIKSFCCGRWVVPPPELLPQRGWLFGRDA